MVASLRWTPNEKMQELASFFISVMSKIFIWTYNEFLDMNNNSKEYKFNIYLAILLNNLNTLYKILTCKTNLQVKRVSTL